MTGQVKLVKLNIVEYFTNHNYVWIRLLFKISIITLAILIRIIEYLVRMNLDRIIIDQTKQVVKASTEQLRVELVRNSSVNPSIKKMSHSNIRNSFIELNSKQEFLTSTTHLFRATEETIIEENKELELEECSLSEMESPVIENMMYNQSISQSDSEFILDTDQDQTNLDETKQMGCLSQQITKIEENLARCQEENMKKFFLNENFYEEIKSEIYYNNQIINENNQNAENQPQELDQDEISKKMDTTSDSNGAISNGNENGGSGRNNGLPDLVNQKGNNDSTDKARKYLEGLDGVKFNEIQVPDQLKKQLEYFDRDELLQLIAYQKKYLDFKESRIKDLENYIDNLVVKIIEKEPSILMNASNVLSKSRNLI